MGGHSFEVLLQQEDEGVFFEVPLDVPSVFGKKRVPVVGTINGTAFRSTIAVYGGRYYLPVNKDLRARAGVAPGEKVRVEIDHDLSERTVEPPADLLTALQSDPAAQAAFDALSYTHKKEYVGWITDAKRDETRRRRVEQTVERLRGRQ